MLEMIGVSLVALLYVFLMAFLGIFIVGAGIGILTLICSIPKYLAKLPKK